MSAFAVELDNHPGELAGLCEAVASSGVNLLLCATTHGNGGAVAFIADGEAAAQAVLERAGIGYLLRPALTVRMENLPGAGAATFRKVANACANRRGYPGMVRLRPVGQAPADILSRVARVQPEIRPEFLWDRTPEPAAPVR
jgi:hypothetical protein